MHTFLDLERFPIDRPDSVEYQALARRCRAELVADGMFSLTGFMRPGVAQQVVSDTAHAMQTEAFHHARDHNIYFAKSVPDLAPDHPALKRFRTSNYTLCADQVDQTAVMDVYTYAPLRQFLADVMGKPKLHLMADPLARVNVMSYGPQDQLNWHFDRSEFTVTLLLQAPEIGGEFEYRTDLRSEDDPNFDGVAALLNGQDPEVQRMFLNAGTLNVFRGVNTPHRVTPVKGDKRRVIAVLSYFEREGVQFSASEQKGFYGRTSR